MFELDSNTISIVILIFIGVFIFFGLFWGLIRGLRKTVIRGIWLVVTAILLIIFAGLISKALIYADISSILSLVNMKTINGVAVNSIYDIVIQYAANAGLEDTPNNLKLIQSLLSLVTVVVNLIVFELLFWILKYLLLPFNAILSKILKSKKEKQYKKDLKEAKQLAKLARKNRGKKLQTINFADGNDVHENDLEIIRNKDFEERQAKIQEKIDQVELSKANAEKDKLARLEELKAHEDALKAEANEKKVETKEDVQPKNTEVEQKPTEVIEKPKVIEFPKKPSKHRMFGGLVGMLLGCFIATSTLMPVFGIFNMARDIEAETKGILNDENKGILSEYVGEYYNLFDEAVENSIGTKILRYTGMELVGTAEFNTLTSVTINNQKISLSSDIKNIAKVAKSGLEIYNLYSDMGTDYSQSTLQTILEKADKAIDLLFKVQIVNALGTDIIPIVKNYISSMEFTPENEKFMNLAITALTALDNESMDTLKTDIKNLINVAKILNKEITETVGTAQVGTNTSIITELLSGATSDPYRILNYINPSIATEIMDSILSMKIGTAVLPEVSNMLLEMLTTQFDIAYNEDESLLKLQNIEVLKESLKTIVVSTFTVLEDIDLSNNTYEITKSALTSCGKVLDTIKNNILTTTTYNSALAKLNTYISDMIINLGIPEISKSLTAISSSIKNVNNWENEFNTFGEIITGLYGKNTPSSKYIIPLKEDNSVDFENIDLQKLGKILNYLQDVKRDTSNLPILENGKQVLNSILFGSVYSYATTTPSTVPFDTFYSNNSADSTDYAGNTLSNLELLFSDAFDYAYASTSTSTDPNDIVYKASQIIQSIKENYLHKIVTLNEKMDWESEFSTLCWEELEDDTVIRKGLFPIIIGFVNGTTAAEDIFKTDSTFVEQLGTPLEALKNSVLFNSETDVIKDVVLLGVEFGEEFIGNSSELPNLSKAFAGIKQNVKTFDSETDSWETEFTALQSLFSIITTLNEKVIDGGADVLSDEVDLFGIMGKPLNDIKNTQLFGNFEILDDPDTPEDEALNSSVVNEIVYSGLDFAKNSLLEGNSDFDVLFDGIKSNITTSSNIDWEDEFIHIKKLIKLDFDTALDNLQNLGELLDSITNSENASKLITNSIICNLLKDYASNYKLTGADELTVSINSLIDKITLDADADGPNENSRLFNATSVVLDYSGLTRSLGTFTNNVIIKDDRIYTIYDNYNKIRLEKQITVEDIFILDSSNSCVYNSNTYTVSVIDGVTYLNITKSGEITPSTLTFNGTAPNQYIVDTNSKLTYIYNSTTNTITFYQLIDDNEIVNTKTELNYTSYTVNLVSLSPITYELSKSINFWSNELSYFNTLINEVDNISVEMTQSEGEAFGKKLDSIVHNPNVTINGKTKSLNSKVILSSDFDEIVSAFIGDGSDVATKISTDANMQPAFLTAILSIQSNINENLVTSWEKEFGHIFSLTNLNFGSAGLSEILTTAGTTIDGIAFNYGEDVQNNSNIITKTIINTLIATLMETEIIDPASTDFEIATNNAINGIITNIVGSSTPEINPILTESFMTVNNFTWSDEFAHFNNLLGLNLDSSNLSTTLTTAGTTIDGIAFNYGEDVQNNSNIITKTIINTLIATLMETEIILAPDTEIEIATNNAINSIITNIVGSSTPEINPILTESFMTTNNFTWSAEFAHLKTLIDLNIDSTNLGTSFTSTAVLLDNIAFNYDNLETPLVNETSLNSKIITKQIINIIMFDCFDMAKLDSGVYKNDFNAMIDSMKYNITGSTTPLVSQILTDEYMANNNFTWSYEIGLFKDLLDSSNLSSLELGYKEITNRGVYYNAYSSNPSSAFGIIYANQIDADTSNDNAGIGVEFDNIVNNPIKSSAILTKVNLNTMLSNIITNKSSSLPLDYNQITSDITTKLASTNPEDNINSYALELQSIQYLIDVSTTFNTNGDYDGAMFGTIGSYFDDIHSSILVGNSGTIVLQKTFENFDDNLNSETSTKITSINSSIDALASRPANTTDIIGELQTNVNNLSYNTDCNYQTQFGAIGGLSDAFQSLFVASFGSYTFNSLADINSAKTGIYNATWTLQTLQNNIICGNRITRYIALYFADCIENAYDENLGSYNPKSYDNAVIANFVNSIDDNNNPELYWDDDNPSTPAWNTDGTNVTTLRGLSNTNFDYAIIQMINDYTYVPI